MQPTSDKPYGEYRPSLYVACKDATYKLSYLIKGFFRPCKYCKQRWCTDCAHTIKTHVNYHIVGDGFKKEYDDYILEVELRVMFEKLTKRISDKDILELKWLDPDLRDWGHDKWMNMLAENVVYKMTETSRVSFLDVPKALQYRETCMGPFVERQNACRRREKHEERVQEKKYLMSTEHRMQTEGWRDGYANRARRWLWWCTADQRCSYEQGYVQGLLEFAHDEEEQKFKLREEEDYARYLQEHPKEHVESYDEEPMEDTFSDSW
jgi:hypothetical protein